MPREKDSLIRQYKNEEEGEVTLSLLVPHDKYVGGDYCIFTWAIRAHPQSTAGFFIGYKEYGLKVRRK